MIHSKNKKDKSIINKISFTKEKITGRAGLSLFSKYFKNIGIFIKLLNYFKKLKRNCKALKEILKELFIWRLKILKPEEIPICSK
jgi:hypothetical protein